jgi:hypothetical protein
VRSKNPKAIKKHMREALGRAVDDLFRDINIVTANNTPVRTGRAKSGWHKSRVYRIGFSGEIVENRVPYIGLLDKGTSPQAPAGYVGMAIDSLIRRPRKI